MVRRHHYEFAHRALPSIMLDPGVDLGRLADDLEFLDGAVRSTWEEVGHHQLESDRVAGDGLTVERRDVGGTGGLLITLPTATDQPEAIFVLVTPLEPPTERQFFTLELGWDIAHQKPCTVLGGWTKDAAHVNFGDGPEPEPDAFIDAVSALAQSSEAVESR